LESSANLPDLMLARNSGESNDGASKASSASSAYFSTDYAKLSARVRAKVKSKPPPV
jgi:hypothetical protein